MSVNDHLCSFQIVPDFLGSHRTNLSAVSTKDTSFVHYPSTLILTTNCLYGTFPDTFIAVLAVVFFCINGLCGYHFLPPKALSRMLMILDSSTCSKTLSLI